MASSSHYTPGRHRRALALIAVMLLGSQAAAQETVLVGVSGAYEFGLPLSFNRQPGAINRYGFDGAGTSRNPGWRGGLYLGFPSLVDQDLGLAFRLSYLSATGSYRSEIFRGDPLFDPVTGLILTPSYRLALESTTRMVEFSASASHRITGVWMVDGGIWGSYRTAGEFTKILRQQLSSPSSGDVNELEVEREEGEQLGSGKLRMGIVASTAARIPLSSRFLIQPELFTRFDAMALGDVDILQAFSLGAGISLLFDAAPAAPDDPVPLADTPPIDSAPPAQPRLDARIDLFSIDEGGARSQVSATRAVSVLRRQQMPFPAVIFFDEGSAEIPSRYVRLTSAATARFSQNDLVRLEPVELYAQALNLLGLRLRGQGRERITLASSHAGGESVTLGRLRAERVRAYLRDVWGIAENRIEIRSAQAGRTGSQPGEVRVEGSAGITAPVVTEWRTQTYAPLAIDLEPAIEAEAGVRFWSVAVRQGERTITSYSSRPEDSAVSAELALHIPDDGAERTLPPLVAELVVEDSTGRRKVVTDTLPLVREIPVGTGRSSQGEERERLSERIYLIPRNNTEYWGAARSRREWLDEIAGEILPGARATVSAVRQEECTVCREVAAELGARAGTTVTVGVSQYASDALPLPASPEGRRVGALLRIEIQQSDGKNSGGRP